IEGNLFDSETPIYEAFNKFNYLLKIDTDLFTFDIQEIRTYEEHVYELNNNMTRDLEETCSDIDGFCNGGELPEMVRVGCMTYLQDHQWNYGANNAGDAQDSQEHKKEHEGNEHTLSSKPTHQSAMLEDSR
ncbi:hypothetical protein Tco_0169552, partial [Tanacetum coccineum]